MLIISMSIRKNINKALFANTKTAAPPNMVKRDHFSKLASDNAKERVQAANALMQELIEEDSARMGLHLQSFNQRLDINETNCKIGVWHALDRNCFGDEEAGRFELGKVS